MKTKKTEIVEREEENFCFSFKDITIHCSAGFDDATRLTLAVTLIV